jgi:hypothetical protein
MGTKDKIMKQTPQQAPKQNIKKSMLTPSKCGIMDEFT